jgi:hypothetical protein
VTPAGGCEVHFRRQDLRSETDESKIHSQIGRFVWEQSGQTLIEWMLSIHVSHTKYLVVELFVGDPLPLIVNPSDP